MAIVSGVGGSVSGPTYVTDVTQWEITLSGDVIDTTKMNATNSYRTVIGGMKSWSGSYTALVDSTTVASIKTDLGLTKEDAIFKLDAASSDATLTGDIVVTDVAVSATIDSAVEAVFTFTGSGDLAIVNGS